MAGLAAAAEARRLGARPVVLEKLDRPGGSMRLSSGVIWRHRDFDRFREECPEGEEQLQRLLFDRARRRPGLARVTRCAGARARDRQPAHHRRPVRPRGADRRPGGRRRRRAPRRPPCESPRPEPPLILATGGFGADRELLAKYVTPHAQDALIEGGAGQHGRRAAHRPGGGRPDRCRHGPGLRARDAGPAGAGRARRLRPAVAAVRAARRGHERARRAVHDTDLVGDGRGPVAAPAAARTRVVQGAVGPARRARARADRRAT